MMFEKSLYPSSFSKYAAGFSCFIVYGYVRENRFVKSDEEYFYFIPLVFICRKLGAEAFFREKIMMSINIYMALSDIASRYLQQSFSISN